MAARAAMAETEHGGEEGHSGTCASSAPGYVNPKERAFDKAKKEFARGREYAESRFVRNPRGGPADDEQNWDDLRHGRHKTRNEKFSRRARPQHRRKKVNTFAGVCLPTDVSV